MAGKKKLVSSVARNMTMYKLNLYIIQLVTRQPSWTSKNETSPQSASLAQTRDGSHPVRCGGDIRLVTGESVQGGCANEATELKTSTRKNK